MQLRWVLALVVVVVVALFILFPFFARTVDGSPVGECFSNVKQLTLGMVMYAQDYDELLPARGVRWMDALTPYIKSGDLFHCPSDQKHFYSYAMNSRLCGVKLESPAAEYAILLFESDRGVRSASDPLTSLCDPPRHARGWVFGFLDGRAKLINGPGREADPCATNLGLIYLATLRYAEDHDYRLPNAASWMDDLRPYLKSADVFHCPSDDNHHYSYAMNVKLSGAKPKTVTAVPYETVLFFESASGEPNAAQPVGVLRGPRWHPYGPYIVTLRGSAGPTERY